MKKYLKYIILLMISFVFIVCQTQAVLMADKSVSTADVGNNQDLDTIIACSEIESLKTENANAYQTADGKITYVIDANKINYKDKAGNWQIVNDNIVYINNNNGGYTFQNASNDFICSFGINQDGVAISRIEKRGYSIEFGIQGNELTTLGNDNILVAKDADYLNQLNSQKNTIIYKDVFPNMDLAYTINGDTLKEDFIVYTNPNLSEITYSMKLRGLAFEKKIEESVGYNEDTGEETKQTIESGIFFDPETGEEIFSLADFSMIDSNGKSSAAMEWDYTQIGDEYVLRLYLDTAFMEADSTSYPVIIDPTIQGPAVTYDTYASQLYPDNNYYLNASLRTGKDTTYGVRRTFIKWTLPALADEYPIISSDIYLYKSSNSGSTNLNAFHVNTTWSSSTLTWTNSPNCDTSYAAYSGSWSGNWYVIDITNLTSRWDCGMYSNYGVKIYDDVESSTSVWSTFYSSDYGTTSYNPKLVITLSTDSSYWALGPHYISNTISVKNNLTSYSSQLNDAVSAWNTSGASCNISITSTSQNIVYIDNSSDNLAYISASGDPYSSFSIALNATRVSDLSEWSNCATGVLVHELGHALGLLDMGSQKYTIMGSHDWNTVYKPTISDITGVNTIW